jgi:hypothetical protein
MLTGKPSKKKERNRFEIRKKKKGRVSRFLYVATSEKHAAWFSSK